MHQLQQSVQTYLKKNNLSLICWLNNHRVKSTTFFWWTILLYERMKYVDHKNNMIQEICNIVRDPGVHHGTCATHVPWCMSGSLIRGGRENVPGMPGTCTTRNFTYLVRGPYHAIALDYLGHSHNTSMNVFVFTSSSGCRRNNGHGINQIYLTHSFHTHLL